MKNKYHIYIMLNVIIYYFLLCFDYRIKTKLNKSYFLENSLSVYMV